MGRADRGNPAGVRTVREPNKKLGPDRPAPLAAPTLSIRRSRTTGDQQDQPRALYQRQGESMIEAGMGGVERMTVQIERKIGRHCALRQLAVPICIEGMRSVP